MRNTVRWCGGLCVGLISWRRWQYRSPLSSSRPRPSTTCRPRSVELQQATSDAALAGHNAWMLVSSALVLFMTAPGLAMFYSGLVRKKNVLGVMMQCIFLMGLMTVVWALWGYSLRVRRQREPGSAMSSTCS